MNADIAKSKGLNPLATIVAVAQAGVDPLIMGTGPIPAVKAVVRNYDDSYLPIILYVLNKISVLVKKCRLG